MTVVIWQNLYDTMARLFFSTDTTRGYYNVEKLFVRR